MDRFCSSSNCDDCAEKVICRCLQVTEAEVIQAIARLELQTVQQIRREIGAGDGCTCCHPQLLEYLEKVPCAAVAVG